MSETSASYDSLTHLVIGAAIEVHREMGPGLLESVYQRCLERELQYREIQCLPQVRQPLIYKGETLGDDFVIDILFPGRLIVELKAVEKLLPIHEAQLLTYLRLAKVHTGLLINLQCATSQRWHPTYGLLTGILSVLSDSVVPNLFCHAQQNPLNGN